ACLEQIQRLVEYIKFILYTQASACLASLINSSSSFVYSVFCSFVQFNLFVIYVMTAFFKFITQSLLKNYTSVLLMMKSIVLYTDSYITSSSYFVNTYTSYLSFYSVFI